MCAHFLDCECVYIGAYLGPSIGTSVSGFLTEFYSWRYPYYLFGTYQPAILEFDVRVKY